MAGVRDMMFGAGRYDTALSPEDEKKFVLWAMARGKMRDLEDYDLRGAWKAGQMRGEGHGTDTYKKPNHPTFSNQSMYSTPQRRGGSWEQAGDQWTYWASPENMRHRSMMTLADYFRRVEPGNNVIFPIDYRLPRR